MGAKEGSSIIHLLLGMASEVPAGLRPLVREDGSDATLGLRFSGNVLRLVAFLRDLVNDIHLHGIVALVAGDAEPQPQVVAGIEQRDSEQHPQERAHEELHWQGW